MRHLFICNNFSGQIIPIISRLARQPGHQVLLASDRIKYPVGIQKIILKRTPVKNPPVTSLDYSAYFIQCAKNAAHSFQNINAGSFYPDNIFIFANSGVSLALDECFPDVKRIIFLEREEFAEQAQKSAYHSLRDHLVLNSHDAFAFSRRVQEELPGLLRPHVKLVSPCIDPDFYPHATEKDLTVFCLKNLDGKNKSGELDKWFESALAYAKVRPAAILLPTYQDVKERLDKIRETLAGGRIWLGCDPSLDTAKKIFSRCDVFISPETEISWPALAAMSAGACVMTAANHEHLRQGINCLPLESGKIESISPEIKRKVGKAARQTVIEHFNAERIVPQILKGIL